MWWLDGTTDSMDMNLSHLSGSGGAWRAAVYEISKELDTA